MTFSAFDITMIQNDIFCMFTLDLDLLCPPLPAEFTKTNMSVPEGCGRHGIWVGGVRGEH